MQILFTITISLFYLLLSWLFYDGFKVRSERGGVVNLIMAWGQLPLSFLCSFLFSLGTVSLISQNISIMESVAILTSSLIMQIVFAYKYVTLKAFITKLRS
ncbi:hypothetical protein K08M3_50610 [Vibrio alginolyticus]|uniref:Uncharacterized protein n=1 Tax=Vibrio alginolyticus TaxID=663 RepID=A0A1W6UV19_VIBAL|nr:hypothetical protein K04M1_50480 [Vibrio alginolyticus]ARP11704.1 hypothetical protein K04M3_51350 [Vibrio alginolyticus]ARP16757.1 hypothetical protein K04M5_51050 [Vibrio alginolyticus]ARP21794.1 hypothetical protein K05K4_50920 [Vibrio alginolyticus]ARP26857.1 hypothetical protein K06K5_50570 [Vibrio alginolyticus]